MRKTPRPQVEVTKDGPYRVTGVPLLRMRRLLSAEGRPVEWRRGPEIDHEETFELCRCGRSGSKPFCDGTEKEIRFDGTETADRRPTEDRRRRYGEGPVVLTDDVTFCASAGFCVRRDFDAWSLSADTSTPERAAELMGMVERCPSGRLVYEPAPGADTPVEGEIPMEIGVVDDGPLWVRGGIPIRAADGFEYEVRRRMTLCRCGESQRKPFCDGSHARAGFKDP
jgi:CDGSH-type Zn-finger protein